MAAVQLLQSNLEKLGKLVAIDGSCAGEPTIEVFEAARNRATTFGADCVVGVGGGSALDLSKLVAAFAHREQSVHEAFGTGLLSGRNCKLICLPTTSGTGSEVSPNAILLDETEQLKKAVISRFLVPDATFIDPQLTVPLPSRVTAFTGLDALVHCVEAYTNKFAHPVVDVYALEGIRLCAKYLIRAIRNGNDLEAREGMSMASMFGGLCLGPVNTAAVHALAYPLGGEFHIPHGLSTAILLPAVFRFNIDSSVTRHAVVSVTLGAPENGEAIDVAKQGAQRLEEMVRSSGILTDPCLSAIDRSRVDAMASAAIQITRLIKNNPRGIDQDQAVEIYRDALSAIHLHSKIDE
jgi:alcohol dehydrogenase class IV